MTKKYTMNFSNFKHEVYVDFHFDFWEIDMSGDFKFGINWDVIIANFSLIFEKLNLLDIIILKSVYNIEIILGVLCHESSRYDIELVPGVQQKLYNILWCHNVIGAN